MSTTEFDPPEDDLNVLAGEFFLGLLTQHEMVQVAALRQHNQNFDAALYAWEARLMPLAEELPPVQPHPRVWSAIKAATIGPAASRPRAGLWNNLNFWRYFGFGAGMFGAAGVAAALVMAVFVHAPPPVPIATAMLTSPNNGMFIATAEKAGAEILLVVSPSLVKVPTNKSAELWLITPGSKPHALGLLASDRPVAIHLLSGQFGQQIGTAELAVSLEQLGGSPTGAVTGPVVAAAKFSPL